MARTYVAKLNTNGIYYLTGAFLLLLGVPLYQLLILVPQGYSNALTAASNGQLSPYLLWLSTHLAQFLGYRILLILAFAALITFPFTLFRIIIAQELLGNAAEEVQSSGSEEIATETHEEGTAAHEEDEMAQRDESNGMPDDAWRGKGFAVLAAWAAFLGIIAYVLGTLASSIYLVIVSNGFTAHTPLPASFTALSSTFTIISNTVGGGLLALGCLFFGAIIARRGRSLWPGMWIAFGYIAVAVGALLSGSAVAVVSTPIEGQAVLTTPAILLFALWTLWFGFMLVRLKPEP